MLESAVAPFTVFFQRSIIPCRIPKWLCSIAESHVQPADRHGSFSLSVPLMPTKLSITPSKVVYLTMQMASVACRCTHELDSMIGGPKPSALDGAIIPTG